MMQCDPEYEANFARWEAATRIGGDAIVSALTGGPRPSAEEVARRREADAEAERLEAGGFARREPCEWEGPAKCATGEVEPLRYVVEWALGPWIISGPNGRMGRWWPSAPGARMAASAFRASDGGWWWTARLPTGEESPTTHLTCETDIEAMAAADAWLAERCR